MSKRHLRPLGDAIHKDARFSRNALEKIAKKVKYLQPDDVPFESDAKQKRSER